MVGISIATSCITLIFSAIKSRLAWSKRRFSCSTRTNALTTRTPARFSCITWFNRSSFSCTDRKSGRALTRKNPIITRITGSSASISNANCGLVVISITTLPIIHSGARVSIRRDISTITCTWLTSLVVRTSNCPVRIRSRLPNENVCTFRTIALRRSVPTLIATRTESSVLPMENRALRAAAPSISRAVLTIIPRSCLAIPSSMTRWVKRGISKSAATTPSNSTIARMAFFW